MTTDSNNNKTTPVPHPSTTEDNLAPEKHIPEDAICMVKFNQTDSAEGADAMAIMEINYDENGHVIDPFADDLAEAEAALHSDVQSAKLLVAEKVPTNKEKKDIISTYQLMEQIPDEAAAIRHLEQLRWGQKLYCPHCGSLDAIRADWKTARMSHWCSDCRSFFSVRTGTVMSHSHLPLRKWIMAVHLIHTTRKGISAVQVSKQIGCTYKTAWFLMHRIREAMQHDDDWLSGVVEIDETYIGGLEKNKHKWKKAKSGSPYEGKTPVIGFKQRDGKVIAFPIKHANSKIMEKAVFENVDPLSQVYTDGHGGYQGLTNAGYNHDWVSHSTGEYVKGKVHTNGIESFWALLKRGYIGTHHFMSWKHLHRYVNEFAYRYSEGPGNGFRTIAHTFDQMIGYRLTYKRLIGPERRAATA